MAKSPNENKKSLKFIKIFYYYFKKHWLWCSIIVQVPTVWFSAIIPFWGQKYALTSLPNKLTPLGIALSIIIIILSGVFTFLNNLITSKIEVENSDDRDNLISEIGYLRTVTLNLSKICEEKYLTLVNYVASEVASDAERATIISNPSNQLKRIIEAITECLVTLLCTEENNFEYNDFLVSIAYRFPLNDNVWRWTDGAGQKELDFDVLLDPKCKSTFNYLLTTRASFYFNNKKENAKKENRYFYTPQDETLAELKEIVGSIFCCRYKIKNKGTGEVYVDSMISVTTQRKRFCIDKKNICKTVRTNMHNLITSEFGNRIGIELTLLYLEYLKAQNIIKLDNQQIDTEKIPPM